jgi:type IV secretory pathway VirJ component
MAVVLSGDGGWRDLDKTIGEDLQRQGIPVVGWDSLRYFWRKRSPEQTARDLATVLDTYMTKWHATEVALIGYSFGADVLPFVYNRLPRNLRSRVVLISLLGFAKSADFQIDVYGWLGLPPSRDAVAVSPELAKISPALVQCFYGQNEADTACPGLAGHGVQVIRTGGGHHFGGDYAVLANRILARLKRYRG